MSKKNNGKLKRIANALKPLKSGFMAMLLIWVISGMGASLFLMQWSAVTMLLVSIVLFIALIVDYSEFKEEKAGKQ